METKMCTLVVFSMIAFASSSPPEDPIEALSVAIPGTPGEDYPIYSSPPETSFLCGGYIEGYYADPEAECQAFHICANFGRDDLAKFSFICPNGTLFHQKYFICDWWFNVDCSQAEDFYSLNEEVAAEGIAAVAAGAAASAAGAAAEAAGPADTFPYIIPRGGAEVSEPTAVLFPVDAVPAVPREPKSLDLEVSGAAKVLTQKPKSLSFEESDEFEVLPPVDTEIREPKSLRLEESEEFEVLPLVDTEPREPKSLRLSQGAVVLPPVDEGSRKLVRKL